VGVEIHESRSDDATAGVDHLVSGQVRTDRGDPSVVTDHDVAAAFPSRVDDPSALDDERAHRCLHRSAGDNARSSRDRTAQTLT
jgi:hypothetical protein